MAKRSKGAGTLVYRKKGWCARITATVDGEKSKQWHPLATHNL